MGTYTKADLIKMWKRDPARQYNIATTKIIEAIEKTKGEIVICFSGGKDSTLLLDMYCEIIKNTRYNKPVKVCFADTTNETRAMYDFIDYFISYIKEKYGVAIDFCVVKPKITWAQYVLQHGIPLISKEQSKAIYSVKSDMVKTGCDYETVRRLARPEKRCVEELFDIGFSKTGVLSLTGFVSSTETFGRRFILSKRWLPMIACEIPLNHLCCFHIKEQPLKAITAPARMTGEQAMESKNRESAYLKTGCNYYDKNGGYVSKPFGPMTSDGILYSLKYRNTPICADYGDILNAGDRYFCSKSNRTGCSLCGFGCQYDIYRFMRLQETEPAKIKFAFKPKDGGGCGYYEAISYMNEYCGTNVKIPQIL